MTAASRTWVWHWQGNKKSKRLENFTKCQSVFCSSHHSGWTVPSALLETRFVACAKLNRCSPGVAGDELRTAVNYSILIEITAQYNAIKSHYTKSWGNNTSSCVHLIHREVGHNGRPSCEVCHARSRSLHEPLWPRLNERDGKITDHAGWLVSSSKWSLPVAHGAWEVPDNRSAQYPHPLDRYTIIITARTHIICSVSGDTSCRSVVSDHFNGLPRNIENRTVKTVKL